MIELCTESDRLSSIGKTAGERLRSVVRIPC